MLTIPTTSKCPITEAVDRRNFLKVGALTLGGLSLADLLRLEAHANSAATGKSVIFVYLPGGPSHIDLYDMKPDAPVEIRGEFAPIRSTIPGLDLCELMPMQSRIADKFAVIRGFKTAGVHDGQGISTGFRPGVYRPGVWLGRQPAQADAREWSARLRYAGSGKQSAVRSASRLPWHRPAPSHCGPGMADLCGAGHHAGSSAQPPGTAAELRFYAARSRWGSSGMDAFPHGPWRSSHHPEPVRLLTLPANRCGCVRNMVRCRARSSSCWREDWWKRGWRVVTLCGGWANDGRGDSSSNLSNWDTHEDNFNRLRTQVPQLDRALFCLIDDLDQRGLLDDVVVVACGEMGRSPRVGRANDGGNANASGRDHWETGFAWIAGGGLRMGQAIGETDRRGERARQPHHAAKPAGHALSCARHRPGHDLPRPQRPASVSSR